jgi:hypothetical protein
MKRITPRGERLPIRLPLRRDFAQTAPTMAGTPMIHDEESGPDRMSQDITKTAAQSA